MKSRKKLKNKITHLKSEIAALRNEIRTLVFEPNSYRASEIKVMYRMLKSMEESMLFGTREWHNNEMEEKK